MAQELEEAQLLLGPTAEIYAPHERYVFDPPAGGYIGIHLQSIRHGFRVPLSPFASLFFRYFSLSPGQLVPNSHRLLTYFQTLCINFGFDLTVDLFLQVYLVSRVAPLPRDTFKFPNEGEA